MVTDFSCISIEKMEERYRINFGAELPEYAYKLRGTNFGDDHYLFAFEIPLAKRKDFEQHLVSMGVPEEVLTQKYHIPLKTIPNGRKVDEYRKIKQGRLFFSKVTHVAGDQLDHLDLSIGRTGVKQRFTFIDTLQDQYYSAITYSPEDGLVLVAEPKLPRY